MYTITLQDGTKLENLELNGNNYIADGIISDAVFADNLKTVTISDGETTDTYTDMKLVANRVWDGKSWFVLAEKTVQEKKEEARDNKMEEILQAVLSLTNLINTMNRG